MGSKRSIRLFLVTLLTIGCGMADAPQTEKKVISIVPLVLSVDRVSGDAQTQRVNHELAEPLVVKVRDEKGRPYEGQSIRFTVLSGDATVSGSAVAMTDAEGLASAKIDLGSQPAAISISARLETVNFDKTKQEVVFHETSVPIPPPQLFVANNNANGQRGPAGTALPLPLGVVARDEDGNGVSGQTIHFAVSLGDPSVQIASDVVTDGDGKASAALSLGTVAGPIEIRATWLPDPDSDPHRTVTFVATVDPAAPSSLAFVSGVLNGTTTACTAENQEYVSDLVLRLTDEYGNRIFGQNVTIDPDAKSAIVGHALNEAVTLTTNEQGEISFRLKAGMTPTASYSQSTTVVATTIVSGSTGPATSASLNFTKLKFLEMAPGSTTWNYGSSGIYFPPTGLFLMYLDYPINLWARGKCWAPLANVSVGAVASIKYAVGTNYCPANVSSWPLDEDFYTANTNSNGYFSMTARVPVYTMPADYVATRVTLAAHPSCGNTNTVVFYSGPSECE